MFKLLENVKKIYNNGENIIQYLKKQSNLENNTTGEILISYDFQAGSYTAFYEKNRDYLEKYTYFLAEIIKKYTSYQSIIEIGVGEATTLGTLLTHFENKFKHVLGFDISWSRIKYARSFLEKRGVKNFTLFTADIFNIPLEDNAIEIVYTSHSLEPNGGKEAEGLKELYRITKNYLILLEPSYEFANEEGKKRMENHGYVKNLKEVAENLGYEIMEHRLFDIFINPLNPTGLLIIKKNNDKVVADPTLICPISKNKLITVNNCMTSAEGLLTYPIIENIPCLLEQNAILTTHFFSKDI